MLSRDLKRPTAATFQRNSMVGVLPKTTRLEKQWGPLKAKDKSASTGNQGLTKFQMEHVAQAKEPKCKSKTPRQLQSQQEP